MIKKFILAILLGSVATLYFVQNDQWVHDEIAQKFKHFFETSYDCAIDFKVKQVNVFNLNLTLENLEVRPKNQQFSLTPATLPWQWHAHTMQLGLSWFSLLGGMLGLEISLDGVRGNSTIADSSISIVTQHVQKLIEGPSVNLPVFLKSLTFKNSSLQVMGSDPQLACILQWDSESKRSSGLIKSSISLHDGSFGILKRKIVSNLAGTLNLDIGFGPQGLYFDSQSSCTADLDYLPVGKRACAIIGNMNHEKGEFEIKSFDQSLQVNSLKLHVVDSRIQVEGTAKLPFAYMMRLADPQLPEAPLKGACTFDLKASFARGLEDVHGNCIIDPVYYNSVKLFDAARVSLNREDAHWHGNIAIEHMPLIALQGSWQWQESPFKGHIVLANEGAKVLPGLSLWKIAEKNLKINIDVDDQSTISGSYDCLINNEKQEDQMQVAGHAHIKSGHCLIEGTGPQCTYNAQFALYPHVRIKQLNYNDEQGNSLISLLADPHNIDLINGSLNFSLFQLLVHNALNYNLQGQGTLRLQGSITDDCIHVKTNLEQGTIRLPETYNFMSNFDADLSVNLQEKKIVLNSLQCKLHRGTLQTERAIATFNDEYQLMYAYLPLTFDSCLLNLKKDLFAVFSGTMSITKKDTELPSLKGHVIIDRAQLNENLLSDKFQKSVFAYTGSMFDANNHDMQCDITVETKNPIRIETGLLQATAKVGMHIKNTLQDPKVSGLIELLSGSLYFPYRPLHITACSIYFMPHQLYDPIIELTAKNKIKKYNVSLQVSGSVQNHHISLESSPPLTEEQIIALLLVGSQEESLNVMMPALIAQNLKTLLFDSEQSPLKINNYFQSWLKPFKNITLVPSFTDQTGRGGLRGAIEVEINDRTRALIQKNFSLTEDTRFEIEYLLSDEVSLRGIRDERKDVGGEIEMRWKFGG